MSQHQKLKVINLIAGPGAGKSTTRAHLFSLMKMAGKNVEEVTEYAKDVTWEENAAVLSDQLYVLANQNRRLSRLQNKVEWVVSDSPLLLSIHYASAIYLPNNFQNLVFELWETYENHNFFILRNKPYSKVGRSQTEEEARQIDKDILHMLTVQGIPSTPILGGVGAAHDIYSSLFKETT